MLSKYFELECLRGTLNHRNVVLKQIPPLHKNVVAGPLWFFQFYEDYHQWGPTVAWFGLLPNPDQAEKFCYLFLLLPRQTRPLAQPLPARVDTVRQTWEHR